MRKSRIAFPMHGAHSRAIDRPSVREAMTHRPKIAFIGAGSTVFTKNIVGDILQRPALAQAHLALMDIDAQRLEESELVVRKLADTLKAKATVSSANSPNQSQEKNSSSQEHAFRV